MGAEGGFGPGSGLPSPLRAGWTCEDRLLYETLPKRRCVFTREIDLLHFAAPVGHERLVKWKAREIRALYA